MLSLVVIGIALVWLPRAFQAAPSAAEIPFKVHIAFGFHVNLYHSFRGDTNDENGFGQDIQVIRHTIRQLDRFNRQGVPVRAVWDFDNLFSLQETLPAYAPDIIRAVQRRVQENNDDVILMSYNNGLVSAMNHEEFMASMQWAISNDYGSGVQDLFGKFAPVVRPQEMMTTAGNFQRYQRLGIDYVSLYYSATPFDSFRLFSRELTPTESYNPITYINPKSDETMVIIPTYHAGDLVEHVSLRNWAEKLHRLQKEGEIDRDVLIFINFDADAEFWTGKALPWYLSWLPNTGGIGQLIASVADLDFVTFSNLTDYMEAHPPEGTVHFSQDTADGSFHGYNSWAEKSYASDYWTRILRNRRISQMARKMFAITHPDGMPEEIQALLQQSFETRLRAMSTTNFGLATPFLARQREAAMDALLARLDDYSRRIEASIDAAAEATIAAAPTPQPPMHQGQLADTFIHLNDDIPGRVSGDRLLTFALPAEAAGRHHYVIADTRGGMIPAAVVKRSTHPDHRHATITVRVSKHAEMVDGLYYLVRQDSDVQDSSRGSRTLFADTGMLNNQSIEVHFDRNGHPSRVTHNGVPQLEAGSLMPHIVYRGERLVPGPLSLTVEESGADDIAAVRIQGPWNGPPGNTRAPGWVDYRLRLNRGLPYLFVEGVVRYPDTYRRQLIQEQKPMLARKIDDGWESVAPLELRFYPRARMDHPFRIHKRNYLGAEDTYAVDYFRHSFENLNVANINNHITSAYAGVTTAGRGMAVAMNTAVNANFAYCPFKMAYLPETAEFTIQANPFGTYHGIQNLPPTSGNRQGYEAVMLSAPQLHSAGPTYNGYSDRIDVMIAFFEGEEIPDEVNADLIAYARRPMTIGTVLVDDEKEMTVDPLPPAGFMALPYKDGMLFHWERVKQPGVRYRIHCRGASESESVSFTTAETSLFVRQSDLPDQSEDFIAFIEADHSGRDQPLRSADIRFRLDREHDTALAIPMDFKAKVLWANLSAWIQRNML
jgi:hypothetical protein